MDLLSHNEPEQDRELTRIVVKTNPRTRVDDSRLPGHLVGVSLWATHGVLQE
jgi:hypothetical protein